MQIQKFKQTSKDIDVVAEQMTREFMEQQLFNKYVPKWKQWLMKKIPKLIGYYGYEIGAVDGDYNKLVITQKSKQGRKLLGKTF